MKYSIKTYLLAEALKFDGDTKEGLMMLKHPSVHLYVLCRAVADRDFMKIRNSDGSLNIQQTGQFFTNNVLGMMHLSENHYSMQDLPCYGSLMVRKAAARDGWGPTLYDIVMEITEQPLINDRTSVSGHARKLMQTYMDGRPDVDKYLLDNADDNRTYPRTEDTFDDCMPGNGEEYVDGWKWDGGSDDDDKWEANPLSYAYNKSTSAKSLAILERGDNFMTWWNLGDKEIQTMAFDLFRELYK